MGFEPKVVEWKAHMYPLSYGGIPKRIFVAVANKSRFKYCFIINQFLRSVAKLNKVL